MKALSCRKACAQCWAFMVPRLQGTAALQVNVAFQGGMASALAKASPFAKGFGGQVGGHVRAVPISKAEAVRKHRLCRRIAGAGIRTLFLSNGQLCHSQIFHIKLINLETAQMNLLYQHFANNQASDRHKTNG